MNELRDFRGLSLWDEHGVRNRVDDDGRCPDGAREPDVAPQHFDLLAPPALLRSPKDIRAQGGVNGATGETARFQARTELEQRLARGHLRQMGFLAEDFRLREPSGSDAVKGRLHIAVRET